jgi:putative FmdB family regulatory protein
MPIYEYTCDDCQRGFEALVRSGQEPACPDCGGKRLVKQLSVPASTPSHSPMQRMCDAGMPGSCGFPECGSGRCPLE